MPGEFVLITGSSGHLGFRVLVSALEAGYRVRAPVRRSEQITAIKAAKSVQPYLKKLEFITVPDIVKAGAYDEALVGVTYVIHSASPLVVETDDYERDAIAPAVQGTVGILHSALNVPTIKRVVITSSTNATIDFEALTGGSRDGHIYKDQDTTPKPSAPYPNSFVAYSASKVHARYATDDFVATKRPHFDIINIMPSLITGKNELITDLKNIKSGSNEFSLRPILGTVSPPFSGVTIHLHDVAKVHVLALDNELLKRTDKPIYDHFFTSSGGVEGITFEDGIQIVKDNFKAEVAAGLFPLNGTMPTRKLLIDSSRTEKTFGIKFANYEEQIKSLVGHYVELAEKAGVKSAKDIV